MEILKTNILIIYVKYALCLQNVLYLFHLSKISPESHNYGNAEYLSYCLSYTRQRHSKQMLWREFLTTAYINDVVIYYIILIIVKKKKINTLEISERTAV